MSAEHPLTGRVRPRTLATGLVLLLSVFGAGTFGQTFVWGILAPDILAATGLGNAEFAAAISIGGLAASTLYLFAGLYAARIRPERLLTASLILTGIVLLGFMPASVSWTGLVIAFVLLRLSSRHMLYHAAEMTISANRTDLGRFGAMLMSAAYPLSLFVVPPVVVLVLAVSDLANFFTIAAAYAFVVGGAAFLMAMRFGTPAVSKDRSAGSNTFQLLLDPRFLLLTAIYCVTFGLDTAALLFHKTLFEGINSVNILTLYALAQIAGTGLATFLAPRISGPMFLWCHLLVLSAGIASLALLPGIGHIGFFLGLGGSIAMSNYAAVYLWSGEFKPLDFARAVVLRGFTAASAGAVVAIGIGSLIDHGAGPGTLIRFSAAAAVFASMCIAAYHMMSTPARTGAEL
ncbi:hypothetical protein WNZ15_13080 [Roseibium sp. AS2]|uniref:hypothetical protein n=1 Tax=Roseibium sp. AS2 TaxID=3135781 RepID=UPI00317E0263